MRNHSPISPSPTDPIAYAQNCIAQARQVLEPAGLWTGGPARVEPEVIAAIRLKAPERSQVRYAVELWEMALLGIDLLERGIRGPGFEEQLASTFACMAQIEMIVFQHRDDGLVDLATKAAAAQEQRKVAAKRAGDVSRNADWRAAASEMWAQHPDWTINKVAISIAARLGTEARPVDKRSVMRSIKDMIPETSPSYQG